MELSKSFEKNYKLLMVIPTVLLIFSISVLISGYMTTGEWFKRDIELKGGTLITLSLEKQADVKAVAESLKSYGATVKETRGFSGYGISVSLGPDADPNMVLDILKKQGIDTSVSSVRQIGSALGSSFWGQAQLGIFLAFIFLGIVVFIIFREMVPSLAAMLCAVSDIASTVAFMQIFDIKLSLAALSALLMLIGYSVDTDIMLSMNFLKKSGSLHDKHKKAVVTGLMMTLTSIAAMVALLLFPISEVITQIASVLMIGLIMDIIYTWPQNSVIMRWYCEKKGLTK